MVVIIYCVSDLLVVILISFCSFMSITFFCSPSFVSYILLTERRKWFELHGDAKKGNSSTNRVMVELFLHRRYMEKSNISAGCQIWEEVGKGIVFCHCF